MSGGIPSQIIVLLYAPPPPVYGFPQVKDPVQFLGMFGNYYRLLRLIRSHQLTGGPYWDAHNRPVISVVVLEGVSVRASITCIACHGNSYCKED